MQAYLATGSADMKPGIFGGVERGEGGLTLSPMQKVSPVWLILAYFVISLGELMLSPMGLSLVSKVAPVSETALTAASRELKPA